MFDIILPRVCVVCGRRLLAHERTICLHCLADMPFTHLWEQKCNTMADRFNATIQSDLDQKCDGKDNWREYERYAYATSLFFYSHEAPYRHILYNLKYEGRIDIGKYFGRMLGTRIACSSHFRDVDCVVPVPLHWLRRWRRGYNQAEILAREISSALGAQLECSILYRRHRTKTQTKLDISAKRTNVTGAFRVRQPSSDALKDIKHILLVDDVYTTGSTLHACFVALRSVFPPSVRISVATLAFVGEV